MQPLLVVVVGAEGLELPGHVQLGDPEVLGGLALPAAPRLALPLLLGVHLGPHQLEDLLEANALEGGQLVRVVVRGEVELAQVRRSVPPRDAHPVVGAGSGLLRLEAGDQHAPLLLPGLGVGGEGVPRARLLLLVEPHAVVLGRLVLVGRDGIPQLRLAPLHRLDRPLPPQPRQLLPLVLVLVRLPVSLGRLGAVAGDGDAVVGLGRVVLPGEAALLDAVHLAVVVLDLDAHPPGPGPGALVAAHPHVVRELPPGPAGRVCRVLPDVGHGGFPPHRLQHLPLGLVLLGPEVGLGGLEPVHRDLHVVVRPRGVRLFGERPDVDPLPLLLAGLVLQGDGRRGDPRAGLTPGLDPLVAAHPQVPRGHRPSVCRSWPSSPMDLGHRSIVRRPEL